MFFFILKNLHSIKKTQQFLQTILDPANGYLAGDGALKAFAEVVIS
jgi:hypothetical protein